MESAKYETLDRKFLDTFYRECGREVTLAYTVLNQTNTWAVTFFAVVMGPSLIGLVTRDAGGVYTFDYPNVFYWLYLIIAWGLLLRFLQRSALALSNMYRWNELATATWEVAALPSDHPQLSELNDKLVELVDRLMMKWQDPRSPMKIAWGTLKLMYLAPFLVLLVMITWGIVALQRNAQYWAGIGIFVLWTFLEAAFFVTWNKSRSQSLRGEGLVNLFKKYPRGRATDVPSSVCPPGECRRTVSIQTAIATLLTALFQSKHD
jgi:hypothetical protein